jgi:hypothetical protein
MKGENFKSCLHFSVLFRTIYEVATKEVVIENGYGLGGQTTWVRFPAGPRAQPTFSPVVSGTFSAMLKLLARVADHSSISSAEVKNSRAILFPPLSLHGVMLN